MTLEVLRVVAAAVGHACVSVFAINWLHGSGLPGKIPDRITYAYLPLGGAFGLYLIISGLAGGWDGWPAALQAYAWTCAVVGAVVLPAVTIARGFRRLPSTIQGSTTEVDLRAEHGVDTFVGEGWRGSILRWPANDSLRLVSNEWRIELPDLPRALDGLSVVHLTDLHMAPGYSPEFFRIVLEEAARRPADLVVFTGDLVEDESAIAWIEPILGRIRGRLGTFAILGNHDFFYNADDVRLALGRAGIDDVDGRWTTIDAGPHRIAIGGTSAPWGPSLDTKAMPVADLRVVLSHCPDQFRRMAKAGVDLVLSGHNHGGQIRIPVIGPILMPSNRGRRYDLGFFRKGRSWMYVNLGLGSEKPLRYRCPIEITRLVLRSPQWREPDSRPLGRALAETERA